ncbi:MAG: hypothetical protein NC180_12550 [Muribaculaceae bacterium]|nr:hypothetical protein [bacterium]MCM1494032.1 hypothetical protein [Muribaculaceae bacterium]
MIRIVDEAECKRYRSDCSITLKKVCSLLKKRGISAQFTLVGSGARNMVTRNGNGPFDLDYNLEIIKAPDEYWNDLRHLKDTVRVLLDNAAGLQCFSESSDSTSCLTSLLYFKDEPTIEFSFDVAIVARNSDGTLCRLIHNKNAWGYGRDQYVWNEIPNSRNVAIKAKRIKAEGLWLDVRDQYVILKEKYLSHWWDRDDHPSFIVYIEAVNNVYNKYFA